MHLHCEMRIAMMARASSCVLWATPIKDVVLGCVLFARCSSGTHQQATQRLPLSPTWQQGRGTEAKPAGLAQVPAWSRMLHRIWRHPFRWLGAATRVQSGRPMRRGNGRPTQAGDALDCLYGLPKLPAVAQESQ